jgi:hypothetical protein
MVPGTNYLHPRKKVPGTNLFPDFYFIAVNWIVKS